MLQGILEPEEVERLFSLFAGVVHEVAIGTKIELLERIRRRALKTKLSSDDHDDLVAAAELTDVADDIEQLILDETGKEVPDGGPRAQHRRRVADLRGAP